MSAPIITLEALMRARAALEAVNRHPVGEPWPLELALQVAGAKGYFCAQVEHIGRQTVVQITEIAA